MNEFSVLSNAVSADNFQVNDTSLGSNQDQPQKGKGKRQLTPRPLLGLMQAHRVSKGEPATETETPLHHKGKVKQCMGKKSPLGGTNIQRLRVTSSTIGGSPSPRQQEVLVGLSEDRSRQPDVPAWSAAAFSGLKLIEQGLERCLLRQ